MKKALLRLLFVPAIFGILGASAHAQTAPLQIAPIKYRHRTLANGLDVYSIENHQSPTVSIQVWYHVGAKNDPEGRSGFAHLFEHIMFKATKNQRAENMDRITEDIGGENNAFTEDDRTVYHETVPSNYAETLVWAEADRMANLSVDEGNFLSERAVVEEEYRQSIMARPYGRLELYVDGDSFTTHPYKRGTIGSIENLDSATLEDVRKFHSTFYRPDNATLMVSGDFDPAQLDAWVDKYFGRIAKPAADIPRVTVEEPERTGEKRFHETGPNVPLAATVITYLIPPLKSEDTDALRIAQTILSRGESSRLNQSLVYRQELASEASADADLRDDKGLFTFQTITAGGKSPDDAEKATLAEIEKLKAEAVTAAELEKARNMILFELLGRRQTAEGQAFAMGNAAVNYGDPERVNTDIDHLQAVTAADVQRVAKKYFTAENRVVIRYENGPEEQGGKSHAPKVKEPSATEEAFTPDEKPPQPSAPREVTFPKPVEKKLANGVRVIVIPRPGTGLVSVLASVKAGSALDPNAAAGLADFTASLLTRGTKTRSAPQIAESVESLGASVSSTAGWDSATVDLSSLTSHLNEALPIFADVVRSPAFASEEIERMRSETLDDLTISLRNPGRLAGLVGARIVFGDSAYGHASGGTPETVKALDAPQITGFYANNYQPKTTTLVFGGDITPEAAFTAAEKTFGGWAGNATASQAPVTASAQAGGRVIVIDKPDAGQAAVYLVRPAIRRGDKAYVEGRAANGVMGEGYSARLNEEIRIKRGLSYGAGSRLDARKEGGMFSASAQTRNDAAAQVADLMRKELTRLGQEPVGDDELVPRKAAISGNYARGLETGGGLAGAVASLAAYDLPLNLNDFLPKLQKVNAAEIESFAKKHLSYDDASFVIVGDGRQFLTDLKKEFPNVEVIPVDKLDLNSAKLIKQ